MNKNGVYGIKSITLAPLGANGAYPTFTGNGTFSFKAIVKDSVQFNDQASSTSDIEIEDSQDPYAVIPSSAAQKGFTVSTYDLSKEAFAHLQGYAESSDHKWNEEPAREHNLEEAVEIITDEIGEFPSKVFQWAKMKITTTRTGTIGKSGFPNLNVTFRQLANTNAAGEVISGARFGLYSEVYPAQAGS